MTDTTTVAEAPKADRQVLDVFTTKPKIVFAEMLPRVTAEHKKSLGSQLKDIASLSMGGNKVAVDEYYDMRLFDDELYSNEDKKSFVGLSKSRKIWSKFLARNKFIGLVEDKLGFERFLKSFDIKTTNTLAITGDRYPGNSVNSLSDAADLKAFFANIEFPVFGKPILSERSLGSARFDSYDRDTESVQLANGTTMPVEQLWNEIEQNFEGAYMFQDCVQPHSLFSKLCGGGLPTIRVVTIDRGNGPEIYRCVAKLTSAGNVADNFWRAGNLLAPVDVETGALGKALTQLGIDGTFVSEHPGTGHKIEGEILPHWDRVVEMALDAANLLSGVGLLGFDIAITDEGPVLVEGNNDPHLIMLQVAHRKGVLDEAMLGAIQYLDRNVLEHQRAIKKQLSEERTENKQLMREALSSKAAA